MPVPGSASAEKSTVNGATPTAGESMTMAQSGPEAGTASWHPMSKPAPCGRVTPAKSLVSPAIVSPVSRHGEPKSSLKSPAAASAKYGLPSTFPLPLASDAGVTQE